MIYLVLLFVILAGYRCVWVPPPRGGKQPPNPPPGPQSHKRPPHSPMHQYHHPDDLWLDE